MSTAASSVASVPTSPHPCKQRRRRNTPSLQNLVIPELPSPEVPELPSLLVLEDPKLPGLPILAVEAVPVSPAMTKRAIFIL